MGVELSGMDEMLARLQGIGGNVKEAGEKALKKGAEVIRQAMSDGSPTGTLNTQSWQYKAGKKYAVEHLKDNIIISKVKGVGVRRYVNVGAEKHFFYAKFFEFGTVKMAAKPFMEPAFLAKRREALSAMAEVIREAIRSG